MGVDYYTCQFCDECFTTSGDYGNCDGCGQMWCARCNQDTETWTYGEQHCCELCFPTDLPVITSDDILDYVLKKTGLEKMELYKEMRLLPAFSQPKNVYVCQTHKDCANKGCKELSVGDERGMCCLTKFEEDKELYCDICSKKQCVEKAE